MCVLTEDTGLEPGLSIEEIEQRLVASARRHHLEERNMAYWLYEVDRRSLHETRGFSSVGDYAMELIGVNPRKAHYLVFIASRLERFPRIAEAFDSGALSWTKAREILRVATPETEQEWLAKARRLTNRELEKEVRRSEGRGSGEFVTLTLSMPVELMWMWNDCHELTERMSGNELEKWQTLEPLMAEYLGTYLAAVEEQNRSLYETEDEKALPLKIRNAVFERDQWQCAFPGCTMRKMLDPHHIEHRSQGGSDDPANIICLCRIHHALIHRGICTVSGRVGVDLKFERPRLTTEEQTEEVASPAHEPEPELEPEPEAESEGEEESEDWREETVAAIFDGPPAPKPPKPDTNFGDGMSEWVERKLAREREERARRRRKALEKSLGSRSDSDEHVFVGSEHVFNEREDEETVKVSPDGAPPGG